MAGCINRATILGNLTRDVEVRSTQAGQRIANLSVATNETWRDRDSGERKERAEFHRVVVFNENLVKIAEQYLRKGSRVFLEGTIQTRKWQDQSGQDRYSTEIVLPKFGGQIVLLDSKPSDDREERPAAGSAAQSSGLDDEIPW